MKTYRQLHRWHIWLGWLVGVPLILWTLSGLVMVLKPIEEVRGNHLRIEQPEQALPPGGSMPIALPAENVAPIREIRTLMDGTRAITTLTYMDGRIERYDAGAGSLLPALDEQGARNLVAARIVGGDAVTGVKHFRADSVPFDFRRPMPVWQVRLDDGTHVYVGADTGQVEAVRTRWWRLFDFVWGIHIMDLQEREDTSHPVLIAFTALAFLSLLFAFPMLIMRQRRISRNKRPG